MSLESYGLFWQDGGGLRREFFDMVGLTMKDQNYKFFSPVLNQFRKEHYFFHPQIAEQAKSVEFVTLFGKAFVIRLASCQQHWDE